MPAYRAVFSALADNADLIALLGEAQIGVHDEGQHDDHNDVDGVALAHNDGEPAGLGRLVQRAELDAWPRMMLVMQATMDVAT